MHNLVLTPISVESLTEQIALKTIEFLERNKQPEADNKDDLLSRTQAAKFLGISTVTLWDWTNKGKIKSYGLGNKIFYKRSELLESLTPLNK